MLKKEAASKSSDRFHYRSLFTVTGSEIYWMKQQKSLLVINLDISRDERWFYIICYFKYWHMCIKAKKQTYISTRSLSQGAENVLVKVSNHETTKKSNIWSVESVSGFDLLTFVTSSRPHCKSFRRSRCVNTLMVFKRSCWKLEVFPSEPFDLSSLSVCLTFDLWAAAPSIETHQQIHTMRGALTFIFHVRNHLVAVF